MKKLILLLIILTAYGCGVKKKALEKEKEKTELTVETENKTETKTEVKTDSVVDSKKTETITEKETDLDIVADSTGVVTVEKENTATGSKITYTGVKTIRVRDREAETKKVDSTALKWQTTLSETTSEYEKEIFRLNQEIKKKSQEKEVDNRSMFWVYGFWSLLLLIIGYIVWKNRKRIIGLNTS